MSSEADAAALIASAPCHTVLPAGAGKTELLAQACKQVTVTGQRVLFLTHTNAGVGAFAQRIRRLGVDGSSVDIRTISAWCEAWCRNYPRLAESVDVSELPDDFARFEAAAKGVLASESIARVIQSTWHFAMVDEYQDCSVVQHETIRRLAASVPTVIVGDPLQSIFDFGPPSPPIVGWREHVERDFDFLQLPWAPHRWRDSNPELGEALLEVREVLEGEQSIDLRRWSAFRWVRNDFRTAAAETRRVAGQPGSSLALNKYRQQCVTRAKQSGGRLEAIEEMNRSRLKRFARDLDGASAMEQVGVLAVLVVDCTSKLPSTFKTRMIAIEDGERPRYRTSSAAGPATHALLAVADGSRDALLAALDAIAEFRGLVIARRELWDDARAILFASQRSDESFESLSELLPRRSRATDRGASLAVAATPLLVKGLEFDHALVLGADQLTRSELYVALTRARHSLVVMSDSSVLRFGP